MTLPHIDFMHDFQSEAGGRDPDSYSPTLQRYHQLLWSKPLPSGIGFDLMAGKVGGARVLRHESDLGVFVLSSDTLANSNKNKLRLFYDRMGADLNAAWHRDAGSIGGRLVFPRNKIEGMQTVNQERGMNHRIRDRFDLTLEAIRQHYASDQSPLTSVFQRYADFFALFEDFSGYIRFFLLDDLVHEGNVRFYLPFAGYDNSPLPRTFEEYQEFRAAQLAFVAARNRRIAAEIR